MSPAGNVMVRRLWNTALDSAGALALDELPDADLLSRFLADRAGPAFAAVVRRHGPLVWGVCRNLLRSEADAEDAFQATFLALARSADRVRNPAALGAWLHAVAARACRTALRSQARRKRREQTAAAREAGLPVSVEAWDRWQAAVHEEVGRLPQSLREAFVVCVLQGVRQPDAAAALGWSLGTLSGRVCQAKKRLVEALTRRGVAGAAGLVVVTGVTPVSAVLGRRASAVGAGGPVPESVQYLARGAIGGIMGKAKLLAAGLLAAGLTVGFGFIPTAGGQVPAGPPTAPKSNHQPPTSAAAGRPVPAPETGAPTAARTTPPAVSWEYKFKPIPRGDGSAAIDLLTDLGADGWEYVGPLPGGKDVLVFKRPTRAAVGHPSPLPTATDPHPPAGSAPRASPVPERSGVPKTEFDPRFGTFLGTAPGKETSPTGRREAVVLELALGETVRHQMASGAVIARLRITGGDAAVADADPTDPKRVLIKAGTRIGTVTLLLTDANGVQESYTIQVKPAVGDSWQGRNF